MSLVDPSEPLERQNEKLTKIVEALMRRVEDKTSDTGLAYAQFERAALLEQLVRQRTEDLERALDLLHDSNAQLGATKRNAEQARLDLSDAIETVDGGFGLFGPDNRLIMANSLFCRDFEDVRPLIKPGLLFHDYVQAISQSLRLHLPEGTTPETWMRQRLHSHGENKVVFNVRLLGNRWIQVSEHRTGSGGTVILQTDVSDLMRRQRAEREHLRDTQARQLQATLDHLEQGVCIFDSDQRLTGWNQRIEDLFPIDAVMGQSFAEMSFRKLMGQIRQSWSLPPPLAWSEIENWVHDRGHRKPLRFETRRHTGQTFSVFAQEMPDRGFVISFTDVTAERNAARELEYLNAVLEQRVRERTNELDKALRSAKQANASKTRFVAAASHDLLQPLSAAKLFIQSVPDTAENTATKDIALKAINALGNAEKIIGDLLDISRLDVEEAPFSIETVRLADVLSSIEQELEPAARAKGLRFTCVQNSLAVVSDPTYLRRILQNIAVNAIRYTDRGKIVVGVRRRAGKALLQVWDTGPGIAETDKATVFQEFKRLNPHDQTGGLGLGLAIVSRACAKLGHEIQVTSTEERGSCFSVELPIVETPITFPEAANSNEATPGDLRGSVVLIVENDRTMNTALTNLIEGWGGQVISALSGEEATELLTEIDLAPDAMLLDYQLEGEMSGLDVFRAIKEKFGRVPARIISASQSNELIAACRNEKLTLLAKPIERNDLASFLANVRI